MFTEATEAVTFCGSHKSNSNIKSPSAVIFIKRHWRGVACFGLSPCPSTSQAVVGPGTLTFCRVCVCGISPAKYYLALSAPQLH